MKNTLLFSWLLIALTLGISYKTNAQLLPMNQPEQDACNALLLCGNSFYTPYSYQGTGQVLELPTTPCSLPGGGLAKEDNSVWLKLVVSAPGQIVFNIVPVVNSDDYDWAIIDMTNTDCQNISANDVIRCNFNANYPIYNNGVTGLNLTSNETGVQAGTTGHPYCRYIDAQAGDVYLIMINNFGVFGDLSSGFTIDFSGSTATFNNQDPPAFSGAVTDCNTAHSVLVNLSKPVSCASIAGNGSDFTITPALGSVAAAQGINCSGQSGYTSQIRVSFASPLPPGDYQLHAAVGTDGNSLLDLCDQALVLPDSAAFSVPDLDSSIEITICPNQLPYSWNGQMVQTGGVNVAQATFPNVNGCDSVVSLDLSVMDTIKTTVTQTICPNELPYVWNGIPINSGGTHVAEFYTATDAGCDSLAILDLYVQQPDLASFDLEGCGSVIFNGETYTVSQTAYDTLVSSEGCDSVYATLHIVVHPVDPLLDVVDTSGCGYVDYQGQRYESSATLTDTLINQYGCDSVYRTVHIIVYPNVYEPHFEEVAGCDRVVFEGNTYLSDTVLVDTFQNSLGCDSAIRTVSIHPEHFELSLSADPEEPVEGVFLVLQTTANVPDYHVTAWIPKADFPQQFVKEQHLLAGDSKQYMVVAESALGCVDTAVLNLRVDPLIPVAMMPNAFSPNGDGLNDVFKPNFVNKNGFVVESFLIFNRWGQRVFQDFTNAQAGWDGTDARSGKAVDAGVYYYTIEIKFVNGKQLHFKGDVTLIR